MSRHPHLCPPLTPTHALHTTTTRCYVATEESRRQALGLGLRPDQLRVYGLPIRPAFSRSYPSKPKLRK